MQLQSHAVDRHAAASEVLHHRRDRIRLRVVRFNFCIVRPGGTLSQIYLKVDSQYNVSSGAPTGYVRYSLDGGATWTNFYSQTTARGRTTDSASIANNSIDFSLIRVQARCQPTGAGTTTRSGYVNVYDIRLEFMAS